MKSVAAALVLLFCASGPLPAAAQEPDAGSLFAAAYAAFSAGDRATARELFQRTLAADYLLSDHSLYHLASIASEEADWPAAVGFLEQLRQRFPSSIWYHRAGLQRAKVELAQKNYAAAAALAKALRSEKSLPSDVAEEALFVQARAIEREGDLARAHSLFQELRAAAPRSPWAAAARREVERLRQAYPERFGLVTVADLAEEARRLALEREHGAAEALYKKLLAQDLEPPLRLRFLSRLARVYLAARRRNEALPVLEEIAREFPDGAEAAEAVFRIGQILWNRNDNLRALDYFHRLMERYPRSPYNDQAYFAAADIYESLGRKDEAAAFYTTIGKRFPHSRTRNDATWRLAWLHYRSGNHSKAFETFKRLAGRTDDDRYRMAARYWQARSAEKSGMAETAIRLYREICAAPEESYYQSLAAERLKRSGIEIEQPQPPSKMAEAEIDPALSPALAFHLERARELGRIQLRRFAVRELEELRRAGAMQPGLSVLLAREFARNQAFSQSVAVTNGLPVSWSERDFYRFPLAYWTTVRKEAAEKELDPYLVVSLIRQESLFDPRARSPASAMGLMQLLPSTAARIARQSGLAGFSEEKLFEPELNIALGTQYLKDLLRRYANNLIKAIAAYNAGEAAVDRWERELASDDVEEFVERIPYLETRQYVKLVVRNHRIYKKLYDR
ncbi:MAG TPA: transglycosylase SLT domain-containing protein [candidate division Zixibacteria bacterium]|nr:transglycosylase SLT domain-containing protein [candidate division Zixibacteria bacterium]